jgi:hypothetical protein
MNRRALFQKSVGRGKEHINWRGLSEISSLMVDL